MIIVVWRRGKGQQVMGSVTSSHHWRTKANEGKRRGRMVTSRKSRKEEEEEKVLLLFIEVLFSANRIPFPFSIYISSTFYRSFSVMTELRGFP
ncbi:hypothetical protein VNO77_26992 [Canavalia gladiata]|uniref:Uncharacterized protein n=1 Tax=Canavalia gladiata TaxID=3824 RepID=A0AAN9KTC1_CANGL